MKDLYKTLNPEEKAINEALDAHLDAMKDQTQIFGLAVALYFAGFTLVVFSPKDSQAERVGGALFTCAMIAVVIHVVLGFRVRRYRKRAKALVDPYMRKKAMPFYQELCQIFAEEPGIHLKLNDGGTITVTDKRKSELK